MAFEVFFRHRNRPVVMNDELLVGGQSDVKFYAVKH